MSEEKSTSETKPSAPQPKQQIIEEVIYEDASGGNGCRGCVYGISGALGCFVILIALLVGAIAVARPAVEQAFSGLVGAVSGETKTRGISVPIVERIQNLSELTTVSFNFSHIVQSEVEMPPLLATLYGDSMVMVAVGHIEAGIDLSQLTEEDVVQEGNTITVQLPPPQLLNCFLDDNLSEVVERTTGVFAPQNVELDNQTRRFALRQFRDMALEDGILDNASQEAVERIEQLVTFLLEEDSEVSLVIQIAPPETDAPMPSTCQ